MRRRRERYPHTDGSVTVIGPECFASQDERVICWKGVNYGSPDSVLTDLAAAGAPSWLVEHVRQILVADRPDREHHVP